MPRTEAQQQVFEVVVRQALAGAPWRDIFSGVMTVNQIAPHEVELEVTDRQEKLKHPGEDDEDAGAQSAPVPKRPKVPSGESNLKIELPYSSAVDDIGKNSSD